jgi:hypothetical protein
MNILARARFLGFESHIRFCVINEFSAFHEEARRLNIARARVSVS